MASAWPDPPPLFEIDDAGERPTWFTPPSARLERVGVFDLETTGVDVANDRIVTAYVGVLDADGSVLQAQHWMADPGIEIPEGATAVHGITTARARAEGRPAREVVAEVIAALRDIFAQGVPVVAYNAPFDFSMLKHEALRWGMEPIASPTPVLDPLVVDKGCDRYRRGKRTLAVVAAHYDVVLEGAHDASADAVAAGRLALALVERYADLLPVDLDELHAQQIGWAREQADSLTEYFIRIGRIERDGALDGSWPIR
ncbi:3'-5' exonuclease [Microbacterium oryzae]|uniref:3'-5' exonuclease n=1 Tax=Microbacterium oryzae TaxID=743009 RepID=A0A6I6DNY2_9MICO|nr:exonuclease domain-containing protein [Microbacterium oryzae]QGU26575.1 3'-5' exonuclease [Microbacterium oryzae]